MHDIEKTRFFFLMFFMFWKAPENQGPGPYGKADHLIPQLTGQLEAKKTRILLNRKSSCSVLLDANTGMSNVRR